MPVNGAHCLRALSESIGTPLIPRIFMKPGSDAYVVARSREFATARYLICHLLGCGCVEESGYETLLGVHSTCEAQGDDGARGSRRRCVSLYLRDP